MTQRRLEVVPADLLPGDELVYQYRGEVVDGVTVKSGTPTVIVHFRSGLWAPVDCQVRLTVLREVKS